PEPPSEDGLASAVDLRPAMAECREPAPDAAKVFEVEIGDDCRLEVRRRGEHEPPWVHDQRTPAGAVATGVRSRLVRRHHETLVLDRPGPDQYLPMVSRRGQGERGRD